MTGPARPAGGIDAMMEAMERAAIVATPGEWRHAEGGPLSKRVVLAEGSVDTCSFASVWSAVVHCDLTEAQDGDGRAWYTRGTAEANAAHIAASCPAKVLALIAHTRAETARADAAEARAEAAERERDVARKSRAKLHREMQAREGLAKRQATLMWLHWPFEHSNKYQQARRDAILELNAASERATAAEAALATERANVAALQAKVAALVAALRRFADLTMLPPPGAAVIGLERWFFNEARRLLADHDREADTKTAGGEQHG